jgi:hypothetical protein
MNCQKLESVICDLAREKMMETGLRAAALSHCDECAVCARSLEEQRRLTKTLRGLVKEMQAVDAPQAVQKYLVAALRSRVTTPATVTTRYRWRHWVAALAAMLLISFAVVAVRLRQQRIAQSAVAVPLKASDARPTSVAKNPAGVQPTVQGEVVHYPSKRPDSAVRRVRPSGRETKDVAKTVTTTTPADYNSEIATEFLPLGYGNALNLQDGGQIVRVEVPRSTLVSFGLPVNMNRVSERVKADVIFGADGSARAIRFVQ